MPDHGEPVGFDDRYVIPYYLQLMAHNAAEVDEVVLREIRTRAVERRSTTFGACCWILGGPG